MSCTELEHRIVDLIDGRLLPPDEVRLHAHLEGCPVCRERLQLWRAAVPVMRGLEPEAPSPLRLRRMELAMERGLREAKAAPVRRRWALRFSLAGLGLAAVAALWIAWPRSGPAHPAMAVLAELQGGARLDGRPVTRGTSLAAGSVLQLSPEARALLALGPGTSVSLQGKSSLRLTHAAPELAVRLDDGVAEAVVAPRRRGERFSVLVPDGRVEVRGTRFTVTVRDGRSTVVVAEGLVAAISSNGEEHLTSPGETFSLSTEAPPAPLAAGAPAAQAPDEAPAPAHSCTGVRRTCEDVVRRARESMRGGHPGDATLALDRIAARTTTCGEAMGGCAAEVGYLRAEALRMTGDFEGAVAAYRALDRPAAPASTRQNALLAAAHLERRRGALRAALHDYERALAVYPTGPLREEAMIGAMEAAAGLDAGAAKGAANRYLQAFPSGQAASRARQIAGDQREATHSR